MILFFSLMLIRGVFMMGWFCVVASIRVEPSPPPPLTLGSMTYGHLWGTTGFCPRPTPAHDKAFFTGCSQTHSQPLFLET